MWKRQSPYRSKKIDQSKCLLSDFALRFLIFFQFMIIFNYLTFRREANPEGKLKGKKGGKRSKSAGHKKPKGGRGQRAPGKKLSIGRKRR